MNTSISYLSIHSINSNLFTSSSLFIKRKFEFKGIDASKFSNHFFYFINSAPKLKLTKSKFKFFLNSVVKSNTINVSSLTFTEGYKYNDQENITITRCIFKKCSSFERGGAISITMPYSYIPFLELKDDAFLHCSAKRGGAIFAGNVAPTIERCCFCDCSAKLSCHAFSIVNHDKIAHIEMSSLYQCPGTKSEIPNSIHIIRSKVVLRAINGSSNYINAEGAWASLSHVAISIIRFVKFHKVVGITGFHIKNCSITAISYGMLFNNTINYPIFAVDTIKEADVRISNTFVFSNIYEAANTISQKNNLIISIVDSAIEELCYAVFELISKSVKRASERPRIIPSTAYFATEHCIITALPTYDNSRDKTLRQAMWVSVAAVAAIVILISFAVIAIGASHRREEDTWLLSQDPIITI